MSPRAARQPRHHRKPPPKVRRRYRLRFPAYIYMLVTVFIAVGAFNSQNNLLFWAFGLSLAAMVVSGILSVPRARKMLGIPAEDDEPTAEAALVWSGDLESTGIAAVCDECSHFIADTNHCRVHNSERTFDAPACRFIDRREPR